MTRRLYLEKDCGKIVSQNAGRRRNYGHCDVTLKPFDKSGKAFIFEFKVLNPYEDERTLEETSASAHAQIEEGQYETELISEGSPRGRYGSTGLPFGERHA